MINLKCESCGSNMIIDSNNKDYAVCEYCGAKKKLSQDINLNINIDDDIKKGVKKGGKIIAGISIAHFVIFAIIFITIVGLIIFGITKVMSAASKQTNEFEISRFNSSLELYSGTQPRLLVESTLDDVIASNKKSKEHQITVVYNEISTTDPDSITDLKHNLKNMKYEVVLDYDEAGYINKVTLKDIN